MNITADTNVLVRAITGDDAVHSRIAQDELQRADLIALTLPALCELVWVLSRGYRVAVPDIAAILHRLINAANVAVNRPAAEAGLKIMEEGGDFADGVIAYEGRWLGADTFVSFDRQAVTILAASGETARLLA